MGDQISGIVVGYDGSPTAELALDWAIATARETGQALVLLHSLQLESVPHFTAASTFGWADEGAEEGINDDPGISRAREALGAPAVRVHRRVGSAAAQLVDASETATLVVTGTRGQGPIASAILGSTAYAVSSHAHCPVVVVRAAEEATTPARPGPDHPVVVGVDDVASSRGALLEAAKVAAVTGAGLRIVRAVKPHVVAPAFDIQGAGEEYDTAARAHAVAVLDEAKALVADTHPDLAVNTAVVAGEPGEVLRDESERAGLVVVGSRGRGGFSGLLLGSVSHRAIHHASCPVMVVR